MDMTGEYRIPASRMRVWEALNDPTILQGCIPGCESLEKNGEEMLAVVVAKIGPVKAKFAGKIRLENLNPPASYTITGEGQGGVAGFARGGADVTLTEEGEETILAYKARADVGGKLAQIGSRLIDGTAKMMADQFFSKFSEAVKTQSAAEASFPAEDALSASPVVAEEENPVIITEKEVEIAAIKSGPSSAFIWALIALGVLILILLLITRWPAL